jgi:hypothetical protein
MTAHTYLHTRDLALTGHISVQQVRMAHLELFWNLKRSCTVERKLHLAGL